MKLHFGKSIRHVFFRPLGANFSQSRESGGLLSSFFNHYNAMLTIAPHLKTFLIIDQTIEQIPQLYSRVLRRQREETYPIILTVSPAVSCVFL